MSALLFTRRDAAAFAVIASFSLIGVYACFSDYSEAPLTPIAGNCTVPPLPVGSSVVFIQGFAFSPATVHVKAGASVAWVNCEPTAIPHTSTADAGAWDTGTIQPGASGVKPFATAGSFSYHCAIHPSMKATVIVDP